MTSLLGKLRELVVGAKCADSNGTAPALMLRVRCGTCGETITTRIEKAHAFQEQYRPGGGDGEEPEVTGYLLEKELLGEDCPQLIHLTMWLDCCTRPLKHEISGGELLEVTDSE